MRPSVRPLLLLVALVAAPLARAQAPLAERYPLTPWPQRLEARDGHFVVDERTRIGLSDPARPGLHRIADALVGLVERATGVRPPVLEGAVTDSARRVVAF